MIYDVGVCSMDTLNAKNMALFGELLHACLLKSFPKTHVLQTPCQL